MTAEEVRELCSKGVQQLTDKNMDIYTDLMKHIRDCIDADPSIKHVKYPELPKQITYWLINNDKFTVLERPAGPNEYQHVISWDENPYTQDKY